MVIKKTPLSIKEYFSKNKPHLKDINILKKSEKTKILITMAINFISFKETDKESIMHSKNNNTEVMISD